MAIKSPMKPESSEALERVLERVRSESFPPWMLFNYPSETESIASELVILDEEVGEPFLDRARNSSQAKCDDRYPIPRLAVALWLGDLLIEEFKSIILNELPDPTSRVLAAAGIRPDSDGLIPLGLLGDLNDARIGEFDVELCRSLPASNSTYWLKDKLAGLASAHVRLDPLRVAPRGELSRSKYAMRVHGRPLDWNRILALRENEPHRWLRERGDGNVESEAVTELVWQPRDGQIVLEAEELPTDGEAELRPARYLHGIIEPKKNAFVHLDGAIKYYEPDDLARRRESRLDRTDKLGTRVKTFRLDEDIPLDRAMDVAASFFVWNDDIRDYAAA